MALGAITKVSRGSFNVGNKAVRIVDVVLSTGANWTAAGESLTPAMVGLKGIVFCAPALATNSTPLTFQVRYSITSQVLLAFGQNATPGAAVGQPAVTDNTNLSGYSVRLMFIGWL